MSSYVEWLKTYLADAEALQADTERHMREHPEDLALKIGHDSIAEHIATLKRQLAIAEGL